VSAVVAPRTVTVRLATLAIPLDQRARPHFAEPREAGFELSIPILKFL